MRCGSWQRFRSTNRPPGRENPDEAARERLCIPITVRSVDVGGLLTRRAFVGGFCSGLAGVGAMLPIATARATYPERPVRIVVPFLPGGGADLIARLLSPHLQH